MASNNKPLENNLNDVPDPYVIGSTHGSLEEYRNALRKYSVARHLSYKVLKQAKACHVVKCRDSDCGFRIRCNIKDSECIVTVSKPHQCLPDAHDEWHGSASIKYLQPAN